MTFVYLLLQKEKKHGLTNLLNALDHVKDMSSKVLQKAQELSINVIAISVIEKLKAGTKDSATFLITKKNLAPWDCPNVRVNFFFLDRKIFN